MRFRIQVIWLPDVWCVLFNLADCFSILTDLYLKEKPSEIDLDEIYKGVGVGWRSLLTHLGLPLAKIRSLQEESRGDPNATCFCGLVFWRDGNEPCRPATWEVLLEALDKGAEMKEYASELKEKVCAKVKDYLFHCSAWRDPSGACKLEHHITRGYNLVLKVTFLCGLTSNCNA